MIASEGEKSPGKDARSAGLYVIAKVLSSLLGLGLLLVLTRTLGQADLGKFVLLYGVYEALEAFAALGIPASLLFLIPTRPSSDRRAVVVTAGVLVTSIGALLGVAIVLSAPFFTALIGGDETLVTLIRLLGFYSFLALPGSLVATHLLATERAGAALGWSFFSDVVRFGAVLIPALGGRDLVTIMMWFAAAGAVRIGGFWLLAWGLDRGAPFRFDRALAREILRYGAPLAAAGGVGKLNQWIDKYVVGFLLPMERVGIFAVCSREVPVINNVPYGATTGLIPALSRCHAEADWDGFIERWRGLMAKAALFMFPVFAYLFVAASDLVGVLYTEAYTEGVDVFRVYLLLIPLRLCMYGGVLRALDETAAVFRVSLASMLINLAMNIPLFLALGWVGPAVSSVLAQLVAITALVRIASRRLNVGPLTVFPWRRLARTAMAAGVAAGALALILGTGAGVSMRLVGGAIAYLVVFVGVGAWVGVIQRDDLSYLRELVRL